MHLPQSGDYIDIHIHGGKPAPGIFMIESLMAHENKKPEDASGIAYTYGIHPWFLDENNCKLMLERVQGMFNLPGIIAIGEAGYDKLKGPPVGLQRETFEQQVIMSESSGKPVIIHCVRAWDDLLASHKRLRPKMPWMIHGFRGNKVLAKQLISKGMYISIWFEYALRPESSELLKSLPGDKFFLETDGADVDIRKIYEKVALDIGSEIEILKVRILKNFNDFFNIRS